MSERYDEKIRQKNISWLCLYLSLTAAITITLFVLFYPPMPGVADQGDFQRVMSVTGLAQIDPSSSILDSYWFKYVKTDYKMLPIELERLAGNKPTTSMIYPIALARVVSRFIGMQHFDTRILAFFYSCLYILGLYLCLRSINIKRTVTYIFLILLSLLILMDGNYLVWFNSLYGEPMMIIGLLFFAGAALYALQHLKQKNLKGIFLIITASFLFLGAKLQCFAALPFIIIFIVRIAYLKQGSHYTFRISLPVIISIFALIFYIRGIYTHMDNTCGVDTKYNSVFYGILKGSKTPEKDLAVLGLSPELAVDAGKHAYLPKEQYVKYIPWSDTTQNEFNKKISNLKLLRFYLLQPKRLITGMEYTASQAFDTRGFLGKYEKSAVKEYTYTFNRFTLWSDFRNTKLPKKLIFLIFIYLSVIIISIVEYLKRKGDETGRPQIELLWLFIIISLLQFPMPYVGNGEADTSKQLFLFNFTFDIIFLISCVWIFDKACNLCRILPKS